MFYTQYNVINKKDLLKIIKVILLYFDISQQNHEMTFDIQQGPLLIIYRLIAFANNCWTVNDR